MVLQETVLKNQKLQKMVTSKYLKHQANKIVPKIMMKARIKNLKVVNNLRNQRVETKTKNIIIYNR